MRESIWGYAVFVLGIISILIVWFLGQVTNTDQQNYNLLKETVEAAMYDAVDLAQYRQTGDIKIDEAKFVENFIRRFSQNASLSNAYLIEIYDVSEIPPKVSLKVSTVKRTGALTIYGDRDTIEFNIVNNIDAILETKYLEKIEDDS